MSPDARALGNDWCCLILEFWESLLMGIVPFIVKQLESNRNPSVLTVDSFWTPGNLVYLLAMEKLTFQLGRQTDRHSAPTVCAVGTV